MSSIRVALCQINTIVGDLNGNLERIMAGLEQAEAAGCDVAVFPELAVSGYPPEDLLLKPGFVADNLETLGKLAARTGSCAAVVGFVDAERDLYNAAAVCARGGVVGTYRKRLLPNYAVFDERRYFAPGAGPMTLFLIAGARVGVSICEDAWSPDGPILDQAAGGAEVILNLNASPYHAGRPLERERMLATRAADSSCTLVYVNQVGGQDELVFDGASLVVDARGEVVARAPQHVEHTLVVDVDVPPVFRKRLLDPRGAETAAPLPVMEVSGQPQAPRDDRRPATVVPLLEPLAEIYQALVLGTRDYAHKNGFSDVVLGVSGGVDSSLVSCIAADAVGPGHVHAVSMPSRFSSEGSIADAARLANNLGIDLRTIPIEPAHAALLEMLAPSFAGTDEGIAEENVQGRIRAVLLWALANKFPGWLVLTCGNKTELAVGYTTVFGVDMAGGFAPIKDVPKTLVYELARHRNRDGEVIPEAVLSKPPSAELRPGQRDDEALPPYDVLDPVVEAYVELDMTAAEMVAAGLDPEVVRLVVRLVDVAEWKRRQSPPGVRVSPKAFGKDRRLPITNRYRP